MRSMMCVFLLLAPVAALAQTPSKVRVATMKEAVMNVLSPGVVLCEGGEPSNNPQGPPCSPGTKRIQIWNRMSVVQVSEIAGSVAPLIGGTVSVVAHCNLDENYYGFCWGTFQWNVPEAGGSWQGTWGGRHDMLTNTVSYTATGFGNGGKLEGLELKYEAAYTGPGPGLGIANIAGN